MRTHSNAGISSRPSHRPYRPHAPHQDENADKDYPGGPKLYRQMVVGFTIAALFGLTVLVLGAVFLKDAIDSEYSISVMLCIMGIVCGLIIVVGTGILGKIFLSRKFRRTGSHNPPQECFQTCTIIYTPSQDQLAFPVPTEQPPPYDAIPMSHLPSTSISHGETTLPAPPYEAVPSFNHPSTVVLHGETTRTVQAAMALPPKYSDIAAPLPKYGDL